MRLNGYIVDALMNGTSPRKAMRGFGWPGTTTATASTTFAPTGSTSSTSALATAMVKYDANQAAAAAAATAAAQKAAADAAYKAEQERKMAEVNAVAVTRTEFNSTTDLALTAFQRVQALESAIRDRNTQLQTDLREFITASVNAIARQPAQEFQIAYTTAQTALQTANSVGQNVSKSLATIDSQLKSLASETAKNVAQVSSIDQSLIMQLRQELQGQLAAIQGDVNSQLSAMAAAINELSRSMIETFTPRSTVKIKQKVVKTPKGVVSAAAAKMNGYYR